MVSLRLALIPLLYVIAIFAVACGDGDGSPGGDPTALPTSIEGPTAHDVTTLGDPGLTVRNAVLACREKDADLLKSFVAADVSLSDIVALFARGSDVQLLVQSIPEPGGDTASVTVQLEIHRDGDIDEVERTWDLVRGDDGLWRLTELPDCF